MSYSTVPSILALDFGTQRIGVAVAHGSLAEPLVVIPHDDQLWTVIQQLITEHQVELIVVGVSENTMAQQSRAFASEVQQRFGVPVELMDETLSSATVHRKLHERNQGKKQYKGPVDHYAAAEFLQEYLDEQELGKQ